MTEEIIPMVPTCRVCGCTDEDCRQCIEKTGMACWWVEPGLCSACSGEPYPAAVTCVFTFGNDSREQKMHFEMDVVAGKEEPEIKKKYKAIMKENEWLGTRIKGITFKKAEPKPEPEPEPLEELGPGADDFIEYEEIE